MYFSLKCVKVDQCNPRVRVDILWGCVPPILANIRMYLKRVGDADEFGYYPALEATNSTVLFQLDNMMFSREQGRYEARIVADDVEYAKFQLEFRNKAQLVNAENVNV